MQHCEDTVRWDVDKGEMNIVLTKQIPGEHFDNLDMLTELLTKRTADPTARRPVVQLLDPEDSEGEEIEWDIPQELPRPDATEELTGQAHYGFNAAYSGVFRCAVPTEPYRGPCSPCSSCI